MQSNESQEKVIFDGKPAVIGSVPRLFISIITLGIGALFFWVKSTSTHYLITTQRIVIETGILSKKTDTVELYLIDDVELQKPIGQRLMGTGNIILMSQDLSNPRIHLERLPMNVRDLYEKLRPAIESSKYSRRIAGRVIGLGENGNM
jgi:hypothetical protein